MQKLFKKIASWFGAAEHAADADTIVAVDVAAVQKAMDQVKAAMKEVPASEADTVPSVRVSTFH